jgi:predicted dehydrogenase
MSDARVGLIGFGLAGATFHAPLVTATPGLELAAIVTSDAERQRTTHREYPRARLLGNVDELWRMAKEIDLVVVASPSGKHFEHAMAAIEAGLSVVVDKPFAGSVAEGQRLIDSARDRRVQIAPFHNRRWDGDFLTVRGLIDGGKLGTVTRFESRFERWRVVPKPRWMQPGAMTASEGMLYDLHPHLIDQALVLFGPVTEVYAEIDRRRDGVQTDDETFVALTHNSGVRSHLKATIVAAQIGPRYRVYGDRGAYVKFGVDPQEEMLKAGKRPGGAGFGEDAPELWGTLGDGESTIRVRTEPGSYTAFYAGMRDALRGSALPPVDAADAVTGLTIIEAAHRSAVQRHVVPLPTRTR